MSNSKLTGVKCLACGGTYQRHEAYSKECFDAITAELSASQAREKRLREALEPFAKGYTGDYVPRVSDYKHAADLLAATHEPAEKREGEPLCLGEIVNQYLRANGFDGLYQSGECACVVDELFPCGEPRESCNAGYARPCECGEGCDFDIGEKLVELDAGEGEE